MQGGVLSDYLMAGSLFSKVRSAAAWLHRTDTC